MKGLSVLTRNGVVSRLLLTKRITINGCDIYRVQEDTGAEAVRRHDCNVLLLRISVAERLAIMTDSEELPAC